MKKRITAFFLCVLLLTGSVYAAGGDSSDPLITLSWLRDTFIPNMEKSFETIANKAVKQYQSRQGDTEPATGTVTLKAGESLKLREGQYFVLLSGSASFSVAQGAAVNATQGWETSGGNVRIGNRYILCENGVGYVDAVTACTVSASYGAEVSAGCPFTDVKRSDWFYSDVADAYARGLVNGMTPTTYVPKGTLTAGQCVKLASCMHQLYYDGEVTLKNSTDDEWYRSYVDYALENHILEQEYADYNAVISRLQFIHVFYHALPTSSYKIINTVEDNGIPDVDITDPYADEIYRFYRAGILTGYEGGILAQERNVTRDEVATIMNRMFDASARKSFSLLAAD